MPLPLIKFSTGESFIFDNGKIFIIQSATFYINDNKKSSGIELEIKVFDTVKKTVYIDYFSLDSFLNYLDGEGILG